MKKSIILLILAAALGAYVYFYEIKGGEERDKEKEAAEKLFAFNKDSIDHLEILSPKGQFIFVKDTDGWRLEAPIATLADDSPISTLLSSLENLKKERTFAVSRAEFGQYGIGPQGFILNMSGKGGINARLEIGDDASIGFNAYAAASDNEVVMISKSVKTNADKSLFDWRDKRAIRIKKDAVREYVLKNPQGQFRFVKEGSDWEITEPIKIKADNSAVNDILNKLDFGRIKSVASETDQDLKKYRLHDPAYHVELFSGAEKARTEVDFSTLSDNISYGRDIARPMIFEVDSTFVKPFNRNLFEFRNKYVVDFDRDAVDKVSLYHNDTLLTAQKDTSSNWLLDSGEKLKSWKLNGVISAAKNAQARKFVEEPAKNLAAYGLTKPAGKLEFYTGDIKVAELWTGAQKDEQIFVYNPATQAVMTIDKSNMESFFPPRRDLVETTSTEETE